MTEMNRMNEQALENVNGGIIWYDNRERPFPLEKPWVVTTEKRSCCETFATLEEAAAWAKEWGISTEIVTKCPWGHGY